MVVAESEEDTQTNVEKSETKVRKFIAGLLSHSCMHASPLLANTHIPGI